MLFKMQSIKLGMLVDFIENRICLRNCGYVLSYSPLYCS